MTITAEKLKRAKQLLAQNTRRWRYTDEQILDAYLKTGTLQGASKILGCSYLTAQARIAKLTKGK